MPKETIKTFKEDLKNLYGDWGVCSEIGKLRAVLMRRPGKEIDNIKDPISVSMAEKFDPDLVRKQHDNIADIYRQNGVQVYYVEDMDENCPNAMYCRDLVLGTPEGVIMSRPGISVRVPEVKYAAKQVMKIGIPIIKTVNGNGIFDGACITWIDSETVFFGTGTRCNESGFNQVSEELRNMGVKNIYHLSIARSQNHLDGFLAIADYDVAITFPAITPNIIYDELLRRGFRIIEIPTYEEKRNLAANFVALEPGKIVMPAGNPLTKKLLIDAGIEVIEVDVGEIRKGGGAVHCLTAFLKRDPIPVYKIV
jgi:N-dimethylarginine dimethylaminohydrolase